MKNQYLSYLFLLLLLVAGQAAVAQAFNITARSPASNGRNVPASSNVAISFSRAISSSTATLGAVRVFSQQRGGQLRNGQGGTTTASGSTLTFDPTTNFRPGETLLTTVTSSARSNGGAPLPGGQVYQFTVGVGGIGRGNFTVPTTNPDPAVGSLPQSVAVGDVDGDGDLDFITANSNNATVSVRLNDGAGNFTPHPTNPTPAVSGQPVSVVLGDVDGDGDLDFITANPFANSVSVRLNDGSGNFNPPATNPNPAVGIYPTSVAVGDVDGDGDLDLLTANSARDNVSVRLNDGSGSFTPHPTNPNPAVGDGPDENGDPTSAPASIALGDVDGDGDLDFMTANAASNDVSVRLNDGSGNFYPPAVNAKPAVGDGPESIALGDVDGDGDLDFVTANFSGTTVSVRLNNGAGNFNPPATNPNPAVGSAPGSVVLGDVDGDGDLDLLTANFYGDNVSVRLNNGAGNFNPPAINPDPAVKSFPRSVALGDVDGDGDLDLLAANRFGNNVSVRLNQSLEPSPTITGFTAVDNTVCVGSPITFTATIGNVTGSYAYTLTNGVGTSIAASSSNTVLNQNLTASGSGPQTFTLTVSDNGFTSTATTSLTVNALPVAGLTSNGPLTTNQPSVTLTATPVGQAGETFSYVFSAGATPIGTTNRATVNASGTYSVTVTNANGCTGVASTSVSQGNTAPMATANSNQTATVGMAFTYTVNAFTDANGDALTYSASISPANGFVFDAATRIISGTPSMSGISSVTVIATDPGSLSASTRFTITVSNPAPATPIRYVRVGASGSGNSWAEASGDLQSQINFAGAEQVWVAAGAYKPGGNGNTDRTISFSMKNGVAIYGGFAGSEISLSQRPAINPVSGNPSSTTLSGDIGNPGDNTDNSYHIIHNLTGLTTTAVLDGFVLTGGKADGSVTGQNAGGGIYNEGYGTDKSCSPLILNCLFQNNSATEFGGALFNDGSFAGRSHPVLTNCLFQNNSAPAGGAINNRGGFSDANPESGSSPVLTNCSFLNNTASAGGAILNDAQSSGRTNAALTNCFFRGNTAVNSGGAIHNNGTASGISNPTLTNCSFQSNAAKTGGAIYNDAYGDGTSSPTLINCSFQNNTASENGGAMYSKAIVGNAVSIPTLTNCVVFGNGGGNTFARESSSPVVATYSLFENTVGDYSGSNNLTTTVSPFVSTTDTRLNVCSPAINAGLNSANSTTTDLAGNSRIYKNGRIDMGAYEYQGAPSVITAAPSVSTATIGVAFSQTFTASGGTSPYSYSVASGNLPTGLNLATTGVLNGTPTQSGSFTITVLGQDANGCSGVSAPYVLTVTDATSPNPTLTGLMASPGAVCVGSPVNITATVGNVTGNYGYTLTNGLGTSLSGNASGNTFSQSLTATGSGTQNFTLTVSTNGQSASGETALMVNPLPMAGLTNNGPLSCSMTSVTLTASGEGTYRFSSGANQIGSGPTVTVSAAGMYSVTVVSGNGCSAVASTTVVGDQSVPVAGLTNNGPISCSMTSVTLTASGGSTYRFSTGANQIGNGPTATVNLSGTYSVTVTADNGCSSVASLSVTQDNTVPVATIEANSSTTLTCTHTRVTLFAFGGDRYVFAGPGIVSQEGNQALVNTAGVYSVTVTNNNTGCFSVTSIIIDQDNTVPQVSISPGSATLTCASPTVSLTAVGAGNVLWSTGSTDRVITVSASGTYSVTIANGNGCSASVSAVIDKDQSAPTASLVSSGSLTCAITSVTLTASPNGLGYVFRGPGVISSTGNTAVVNVAGTYSVTVTNATTGCASTTSITIGRDASTPVATVSASPSTTLTCAQTSLTLTAGGGNTYVFSGPGVVSQSGNQAIVNASGVYSVTVSDPATGCLASTSLPIVASISIAPPVLLATATSTTNQPISVTATGCVGTVNWTSLGGSGTANGALYSYTGPGSYTLSATCSLGPCSSPASPPLTLLISPAPVADGPLQLIAPTYNCSTGAITFRTTGGDKSAIEFRAIGVTDWTINPGQTVDLSVRQDPNSQPLLLQARQNGVMTSYRFDFRLFCNSTTPNQPPVFTQPPTQTATVGQLFSYRLPDETFRDLNGTAVNFMTTGLPDGLSYQPATRIISGTPTAVGSYSVTLTVSDPLSLSASGTLVLMVNPAPQPPVSTTINQAPVFNGPLAAQSGVVGATFTYTLPPGVFSDPNAGDGLTYTVLGLPAELQFSGQTIRGIPTTVGTSSVTLTATDTGGLSASGVLTIIISATAPPPPSGTLALSLIQPLYDCQSGAITFRTTGGDGSAIYFSSVGIVGFSTQTSYVVEAPIRDDPNSQPLVIRAIQNGVTASYVFDFRLYCNGTVMTPPPVFNGPLPVQMGTVGVSQSYQIPGSAFTALNGGTLNYSASGLPAGLALNAGTGLVSGVPTQAGSFTALLTATDPVGQSGRGPLVYVISPASSVTATPPVTGMPLSLVAPAYQCQTGTFSFQTRGGDGSRIEYMAVGITGWSPVAGPYTVLPAADAQPFTLKARQNGLEVTYIWDYKAVCSGSGRVSVETSSADWMLVPIGNPVTGELTVELVGAAGQVIEMELANEQGHLVESRVLIPATSQYRTVFDVSGQGAGVLLLRAVSPSRSQTLKVLKR